MYVYGETENRKQFYFSVLFLPYIVDHIFGKKVALFLISAER